MFDLKEYEKSHETDSPIRNKWFKFFNSDDSNCPYIDLPEYPSDGSFVENQRKYQIKSDERAEKYCTWMEDNWKDTLVQITNPFKIWLGLICNAPINQFPFTLIFFFLQLTSRVDYIVFPDIYLGKNKFILGIEKAFLWIVSKILFGWAMVWLYTVTLFAIIGNILNTVWIYLGM